MDKPSLHLTAPTKDNTTLPRLASMPSPLRSPTGLQDTSPTTVTRVEKTSPPRPLIQGKASLGPPLSKSKEKDPETTLGLSPMRPGYGAVDVEPQLAEWANTSNSNNTSNSKTTKAGLSPSTTSGSGLAAEAYLGGSRSPLLAQAAPATQAYLGPSSDTQAYLGPSSDTQAYLGAPPTQAYLEGPPLPVQANPATQAYLGPSLSPPLALSTIPPSERTKQPYASSHGTSPSPTFPSVATQAPPPPGLVSPDSAPQRKTPPPTPTPVPTQSPSPLSPRQAPTLSKKRKSSPPSSLGGVGVSEAALCLLDQDTTASAQEPPSKTRRSLDLFSLGPDAAQLTVHGLRMLSPKYRWSCFKKEARRRGLPVLLTYGEFIGLIYRHCSYCGIGPTMKRRISLDRVNSSLPYKITNVVPCCFLCNSMKGSLSLNTFLGHITRIVLLQQAKAETVMADAAMAAERQGQQSPEDEEEPQRFQDDEPHQEE